jgi:hypothetical protein
MREQSTAESNDESLFETNTLSSQQQQQQQQQLNESNIHQVNSLHQHLSQSKNLNDKIKLKENNSEQFI